MNEFLKTLLSLSLSGTLLFLLVRMPRGLYRERFSRRWQYYIWLVVALRFLVPFAPGATFTGYLFDRAGAAISAAGSDVVGSGTFGLSGEAQTPDGQADYISGKPDSQADYADGSSNGQADYPNGTPDGQADHTDESPNGWTALMARLKNLPYLQTGAFSLWLTVAAALLIRKATAYQSFLGFLKAGSTQVSDIEALNLLSDCMERLHISGKAELYTNPLIASPILTGFFRPRIILPCRQGPEPEKAAPADSQQQTVPTGTPEIRKKDLSYIFIHELIHYRRKDMFYKWFIQLILCVHWFNPFVYLLGKEVGRACELACDESVTAGLDDTEKKAYGNTLLASLQTGNAYKNPLASVTLTESARELKERLGAIMKTHKKTKSMTLLTVLATAAICTAFGTLGAYARSDSDNPGKSTASAPNRTEHYDNAETPGNIESPAAANAPGSGSAGSAAVSYTFVQRGYYQDSFIIELGWNLSAGGQTISQARRAAATLEDGSRMNVYFADAAREYAEDSEALAAVGRLIDSLRKNNLKGYPDLETPLVSSIRKVDGSNLPALAREFMANQDLTGFSAVFPALDAQAQEECCQALYEDADIAFFASIAPFLEEDLLLSFLDRADKDGNISFFTAMLIIGSVPADRLSEDYAEKYYENDDISSFSAIVSFLPEKEQRRFLEKARKDQKPFFQKVLSDALSQSASSVPANNTGNFQDSLTDSGRIVYEGADILFYEDGSPYLRDILANRTDRTVTEAEYCILAYDSQGHPLQLQWNFMDSSAEAAYENLTRRTGLRLGPNQTTEAIPGGWSLSDEDAARISYAICCLKEVVFEDGTAWSNPDYEDWHEAYAGKEVSTEELEDYYPCAYAIRE